MNILQNPNRSDNGRVTILTGFFSGPANPIVKNQGVGVYATKLNGEVKRFFPSVRGLLLQNALVVDPIHSGCAGVRISVLETKRVLVLERGLS